MTELSDERVAELVDRITNGSDDTGRLANDVLAGFERGVSVDKLVVLLRHPNPRVSEVGVWIAAELGSAAAPLVDELPALLHSPSRDARFYAIEMALTTAVGVNSDLAAQVLPLLDDADGAVQWKATGFLARASIQQLAAALSALTVTAPGSRHVSLLRWLLSDDGRDPSRIQSQLDAGDGLTRRYAVAAAARIAQLTDEPLQAAGDAADREVRRFAQGWLRIVRDRQKDRGTGRSGDQGQPGIPQQ